MLRDYNSKKVNGKHCLIHVGRTNNAGYGLVGSKYAHRKAYEDSKGPIPDGKIIRHKCNNRLCVEPDHLEAGTYKENYADMVESGNQNNTRKKLSDDQINRILESDDMIKDIAAREGLTEREVINIRKKNN